MEFLVTGGDDSTMLPVLAGTFGAVAAGMALLMRRKKKTAIQAPGMHPFQVIQRGWKGSEQDMFLAGSRQGNLAAVSVPGNRK